MELECQIGLRTGEGGDEAQCENICSVGDPGLHLSTETKHQREVKEEYKPRAGEVAQCLEL